MHLLSFINNQGHHTMSEFFCCANRLMGRNSQKHGSISYSQLCWAYSFDRFFQRYQFPSEGARLLSFCLFCLCWKTIEIVKSLRIHAILISHVNQNFWLPAACDGAALEANITVVVVLLLLLVLLMSFTQNLLLSLIALSLLSIIIA